MNSLNSKWFHICIFLSYVSCWLNYLLRDHLCDSSPSSCNWHIKVPDFYSLYFYERSFKIWFWFWGALVDQLVKQLTLAGVLISWLISSSPHWTLPVWSLLLILCFPLSFLLTHSCMCAFSLKLTFENLSIWIFTCIGIIQTWHNLAKR